MVNRNIKESLNLVSVQVHRDNTVDTSSTKQIGHQLGSDADAWLIFAVLTSPSEIGDDGIDGARRGSLGSINHQQQLHKIVTVRECALYKENIATANTFLIRDGKLAVGELGNQQFTQRTT